MQINTEQLWIVVKGYGLSFLGALAILIIGCWISKWIRGGIHRSLEKAKMDVSLSGFLSNLAYFGLMAFFVIAALNRVGVSTGSFVAVVGAAGLAIALSLQGSLSNFAAGVMLMIFRPFTVGHYIEGGGVTGSVQKIEIFTTTLLTPDNKEVIVPNSAIISGSITNFSSTGKRRIDMVFGVSYSDDLKKVRRVIEEVLAAEERILNEPETVIAVSNLGDSSVDFVVRPWVNTADYWGVLFNLTEQMKIRFDEEGISIPFPQRDVHLIGAPTQN